jgi:hypothetical protein
MEACSGAHFLARALVDQGHKVRLMPAEYVRPYVKSNKNDFIDAAVGNAIAFRKGRDFAAWLGSCRGNILLAVSKRCVGSASVEISTCGSCWWKAHEQRLQDSTEASTALALEWISLERRSIRM